MGWKDAALRGFELGYKQEDSWHPAVRMVTLLNEPSFFEGAPSCQPSGSWCHGRAIISTLDGFLAAEKEAGVKAGRVNITIAWSFAMRDSLDGKVKQAPGYFGFQDMKAVVADPGLVGYEPRMPLSEIQNAYRTRWVNCLNTQAPWTFVQDVVGRNYAQFEPTPWVIGEYGANGQPRSVIQSDLESMQVQAADDSNAFMGVVFFQFQTADQKGGSELNFGMFNLGNELVGETGNVWDDGLAPRTWPVYCLSKDLPWLAGTLAHRADAVAAAWGGFSDAHNSMCTADR